MARIVALCGTRYQFVSGPSTHSFLLTNTQLTPLWTMEASLLLKTAFIIYQVVLAENWDTCFKNQYYTCEHQLLDCFRAITMVAIHLKMENPRDMSQVQKSSIYERGSKILETWARFTLDEECGDRMLVGASIGRDCLERKFIKSDARLPCTVWQQTCWDTARSGILLPIPDSQFPIPPKTRSRSSTLKSSRFHKCIAGHFWIGYLSALYEDII